MNYVINPMIFYWLQVVDVVWTLAVVVMIVCALLVMLMTFATVDCFNDEESKRCKRIRKIAIVIGLCCLTVMIFCPNKDTILAMLISKLATKDNVNLTLSGIKEAVDYIIKASKAIK